MLGQHEFRAEKSSVNPGPWLTELGNSGSIGDEPQIKK